MRSSSNPSLIIAVALAVPLATSACSTRGRSPSGSGTDTGSGEGPRTDVAVDSGIAEQPSIERQTPPADTGDRSADCASAAADHDLDGDGFRGDRDCNECSANVNMGALDLPTNGVDEDCDGSDALEDVLCDAELAMASSSPEDAARALGLCRFVGEDEPGWGVVSARFTRADGTDVPDSMLQVGLLPNLGVVTAPVGGTMLALSTGVARGPDQAAFTSECDFFGAATAGGPFSGGGSHPIPAGFDGRSPSCPAAFPTDTIYNSVALELRVRVPSNANGIRFASNFYTAEYPLFICSQFNDYFVTMLERGGSGSAHNIVFDAEGNPVSVNNGLLQVCDPGTNGGKQFDCPLGREELNGTGYEGGTLCSADTSELAGFLDDLFGGGAGGLVSESEPGAATGWLRTTAPVTPGEIITLRFAIWDTGDPDLDSLVLIDGFQWEAEEGEPPPVMTEPELF